MKNFFSIFLFATLAAICCRATEIAQKQFVLENNSLARTLSITGGKLQTVQIINKLSGATIVLTNAPEFRLRLSQGTDKPETQITLTSSDFQVVAVAPYENGKQHGFAFTLTNSVKQLGAKVFYELSPDEFFMRKRLVIASAKAITLERIDVDDLKIADAYQPYTTREITANASGRWNPGLGQPLYTSNSATFWGIEFPAADNQVRDGSLYDGYLWGRKISAGEIYQTYSAVMGVADNPNFIKDAFFDYINRIRIRPLRLQVQYNSWFDFGKGVSKEKFAASVAKVNDELVVKRGNPPLNAYVIDDGWEDTQADWSNEVWQVNGKFDSDFASSLRAANAANSHLGLWLSPGCLFGANIEVAKMRTNGFEALDNFMSMAGPRYMTALQDRLEQLTRQGIVFYKFDGLFGHLNIRDFDLHGEKYGVPEMPQLGLDGFTASDKRLNNPKYDELKIYYLTAGTERLMQIFSHLGRIDPNIYIVISNGAYLSPWWLMYVDTVWMINAGDAASGSSRDEQLIYRDGRYYDIWREKNIQFPMCAVFNHEPKKTTTGESPDEFRKYLFMCLSRGTGFLELYIKPSVLQSNDWNVLSDGLHWAREEFPTFSRVRMHGGNPVNGEVYGYTAWNQTQGYISVHNPSDKSQTYTVKLDHTFGLPRGNETFYISSPLGADSLRGLPKICKSGDSLTFQLAPREIRIVDFNGEGQN